MLVLFILWNTYTMARWVYHCPLCIVANYADIVNYTDELVDQYRYHQIHFEPNCFLVGSFVRSFDFLASRGHHWHFLDLKAKPSPDEIRVKQI